MGLEIVDEEPSFGNSRPRRNRKGTLLYSQAEVGDFIES